MKKKSVKIVPSNPNFKKLKYNALRYFHGSECHVEIEENTPLTVGGVVKVTESLTISIADGSWIEIGSGDQLNQLEIRTIAAPNGKGKGTYLMKVFLKFVLDTLGFIPKVCLECTGFLWGNGQFFKSSVSDQTKFFRKFGFRVTSKKGYPYYVKMEFDHTKIKLQQFHLDQFKDSMGIAA